MTAAARRSPGLPVGKIIISAVAVLPTVGAFVADWNETHVYNPTWPAHAKFHNAQTITLAVEATALSLWQLWRPGPDNRSRLRWASLFAGLFFLTQIPAAYFPGSALVDDDNPVQPFDVLGIQVNQVSASVAIVLPLLSAGYALATRQLRHSNRHRSNHHHSAETT